MVRRDSSAPWARPLLAILGFSGAALTGYLTWVKFTGSQAACPTEGCETVLTSAYAEVAGLPLSLFGLGAYFSMAVLALTPNLVARLAAPPAEDGGRDEDIESTAGEEVESAARVWRDRTWPPLFWLSTAMVAFSAYLMVVLTTDLKVLCLYCLGSAALSLGLWLTTLLGRRWDDLGKLSFDGLAIAIVVGFASLYLYQSSPSLASEPGYHGPEITSVATTDTIALAQHLSDSGAVMYGAYWCSHCYDQKTLFGKEAIAALPYIECDAKGVNAQPKTCRAEDLEGYPTWKIKGELLGGTQSLEDLAKLSGYGGSQVFEAQP